MRPLSVAPQQVPAAVVRRLDGGAPEGPASVQQVEVARVPAPLVIPRQIDPVGLRVTALQLENQHLRDELDRRTA